MDKKTTTVEVNADSIIDCACVIHGDAYSWTYVEKLYNMLDRHLSCNIRLHVYTESHRPVPAHMIKHVLLDWGIGGPKQSWWYKMQLFDSMRHAGPLLYFDLDTVIVNNIDWICKLPSNYFWSVRDFKYLWKPNYQSVNSSIMWWDTTKFHYVWESFQQQNLKTLIKKYRGDQDYITHTVPVVDQRFLDSTRIKSWRWQCLDGGHNFKKIGNRHSTMNTVLDATTDVMIFHGQPKPSDVQDPVILQHWK